MGKKRYFERGCLQAKKSYEIIKKNIKKNIKEILIFSSALNRAYETAEIFSSKIQPKPEINKLYQLNERYYGDYSNANEKNILSYVPEDAESSISFQERVHDIFIELLSKNSNKGIIIIVSHQKVFECLTNWLIGEKLKLSQGGVCSFKKSNKGFNYKIFDEKWWIVKLILAFMTALK